MQGAPTTFVRLALALTIAIIGFALDVSVAYAQSSSCSRLNSQLRTFERNSDFRNAQKNNDAARQLAAELQDAESAYVRTGCNDAAKAGQTLTRDCRDLARTITRGRAQSAELSQKVETANAILQQREALLQEIARFGCNGGSSVTITQQDNREGLFDQLFGGFTTDGQDEYGDGAVVGDEFSGYGGYQTVRTVCVRLSDGYFWPVSYSTLPDFVGNDAASCQAQCPGTPVDLYFYDNPGQEPEQMRNMAGMPYTALPSAFRYRSEYDKTASCTVQAQGSFATLGGSSGQLVEYEGMIFPMPKRDPRTPAALIASAPVAAPEVVEIADNAVYVDIPMPRRRPGSQTPTVTQPLAGAEQRVVLFGDKRVRIVGPETPYAQAGEAGT